VAELEPTKTSLGLRNVVDVQPDLVNNGLRNYCHAVILNSMRTHLTKDLVIRFSLKCLGTSGDYISTAKTLHKRPISTGLGLRG
jgi:hypothetical protein